MSMLTIAMTFPLEDLGGRILVLLAGILLGNVLASISNAQNLPQFKLLLQLHKPCFRLLLGRHLVDGFHQLFIIRWIYETYDCLAVAHF